MCDPGLTSLDMLKSFCYKFILEKRLMKPYLQMGVMAILAATVLNVVPIVGSTVAKAQTRPILEELDLTEEQQSEIQGILQNGRVEAAGILTEEQQQQFREALLELGTFRQALGSIENLTDTQKESLRAVFVSTRQSIIGTLTDEQLAELRSLIEDRRQNQL
jgi:hypothetical protein